MIPSVKYQNNTVSIFTQTLIVPGGEVPTISELISAFQGLPGSPLASAFIGHITIKLPNGVPRSLELTDYFMNSDESDTTLIPECPLSVLIL